MKCNRYSSFVVKYILLILFVLFFCDFLHAAQNTHMTNSLIVDLKCQLRDKGVGMGKGAEMKFSNNNLIWSLPEPYNSTKKNWNLADYGGTSSEGERKIYAKYSDSLGNWMEVPVVLNVIYTTRYGSNIKDIPILNGWGMALLTMVILAVICGLVGYKRKVNGYTGKLYN